MLFYFISLIILKNIITQPLCIEGKNNCLKCHPSNNLCLKCDKEIYTPDINGGCEINKKCILGNNYCEECNQEDNLCKTCGNGYFPDEYGGCSYTSNCEISYRGECLKCRDDYILIGQNNSQLEGIRICKSLNSEDFRNCENIDIEKGKCSKCKDGYYLNELYKKCTTTKNCKESIFGVCKNCIFNHYLDKSCDECKLKTDNFKHCKESIDGKTCSICEDYYFFDDNQFCTQINYCSQSKDEYVCEKCISGYYLTGYGESCTPEKNCHYGNKALGICTVCKENFYIDISDGKCKSNIEDDEFKNCFKANKNCINCINGYYIDEQNMCAETGNCAYSEEGICLECSDNYFLDLDNNCVNVKNCIHSISGYCLECKDKYYFNKRNNTCVLAEGYFENCKVGYDDWICIECKNDFYLNESDSTCYSNKEEDYFYKCKKTEIGADICIECIDGYFLGTKDNKCSKIEGCSISEKENKCIECDENYCLDEKLGICQNNEIINEEGKKFYYKCNKTNSEGTACEICLNDFELNENGLCVDNIHCEEKENDICVKCQDNYCLSKDFGCVFAFYGNCLECNNILDFDVCTKCVDGYKVNEYGVCVEEN